MLDGSFLDNLNAAVNDIENEKKKELENRIREQAAEEERKRIEIEKNKTPEGRHDYDTLTKAIDSYFANKSNQYYEVFKIRNMDIALDEDAIIIANIYKVFDGIGYSSVDRIEKLIDRIVLELDLEQSVSQKKNLAIMHGMELIALMSDSIYELCVYRNGILKKFNIGDDAYYNEFNKKYTVECKNTSVFNISFSSGINLLGEVLRSIFLKNNIDLNFNYKGEYYSIDSIIEGNFRYTGSVSGYMVESNIMQFSGELAVGIIEDFASSILNRIEDLCNDIKTREALTNFMGFASMFCLYMSEWIEKISDETINDLEEHNVVKNGIDVCLAIKYRDYLHDVISTNKTMTQEEIREKVVLAFRLDPISCESFFLLRDFFPYDLADIYSIASKLGKRVAFEGRMLEGPFFIIDDNKELNKNELTKYKILLSNIEKLSSWTLNKNIIDDFTAFVNKEQYRHKKIEEEEKEKQRIIKLKESTTDYLKNNWKEENLDFSMIFWNQYDNNSFYGEEKNNKYLFEIKSFTNVNYKNKWNHHEGQRVLFDGIFLLTNEFLTYGDKFSIPIADIREICLFNPRIGFFNSEIQQGLFGDVEYSVMLICLKNGGTENIVFNYLEKKTAKIIQKLQGIFAYFYEQKYSNANYSFCVNCKSIVEPGKNRCPQCNNSKLHSVEKKWNYTDTAGWNYSYVPIGKGYNKIVLKYLIEIKEKCPDLIQSINNLDLRFIHWNLIRSAYQEIDDEIDTWRNYYIFYNQGDMTFRGSCFLNANGKTYVFEKAYLRSEQVFFCGSCRKTCYSVLGKIDRCPHCGSDRLEPKWISAADWKNERETYQGTYSNLLMEEWIDSFEKPYDEVRKEIVTNEKIENVAKIEKFDDGEKITSIKEPCMQQIEANLDTTTSRCTYKGYCYRSEANKEYAEKVDTEISNLITDLNKMDKSQLEKMLEFIDSFEDGENIDKIKESYKTRISQRLLVLNQTTVDNKPTGSTIRFVTSFMASGIRVFGEYDNETGIIEKINQVCPKYTMSGEYVLYVSNSMKPGIVVTANNITIQGRPVLINDIKEVLVYDQDPSLHYREEIVILYYRNNTKEVFKFNYEAEMSEELKMLSIVLNAAIGNDPKLNRTLYSYQLLPDSICMACGQHSVGKTFGVGGFKCNMCGTRDSSKLFYSIFKRDDILRVKNRIKKEYEKYDAINPLRVGAKKKTKKQCPQCARMVAVNVKFCNYCGQRI